MPERIRAADLLREAAAIFDAGDNGLRQSAGSAWRTGFSSGGHWMREALQTLRGTPLPGEVRHFNALGLFKYALASAAGLLALLPAIVWRQPLLLLLAVPAFYAVEAQFVFLFPVALDGSRQPLGDSRRWTAAAGGTLAVMRVVLPLACVMVFGGFTGRGFVRCWCLGCLAICIWYEKLHNRHEEAPAVRFRFPLRFGASGPLLIRHERVVLGLAHPWRVFYASDLHLGHWWTRGVASQVIAAANEARAEVILLGGDLADSRRALPEVATLVQRLAGIAPVYAVPGNHDPLDSLRDAVVAGGGGWLPDRSAPGPAQVDGAIRSDASSQPRILCAHYPSLFPAAMAAGYRVVLAGHLHGGQCVLATRKGRLYPAVWFHRWHGLRFDEPHGTMLVSRGVADTFPVRFGCPREVLLCEVA
jgi:predicted MPP superfamily phosphohydrolase